MKLKKENSDSEKIVIEKNQHEHKLRLEKSIKPHKNHKIYEFNTKTKQLYVAEFMDTPIITWENAVAKKFPIYRKILKKENCIYISALNEKNAYKILKRDYGFDF